MSFRGTYKGDEEEVKFVCDFNQNKSEFHAYLNNFTEGRNINNLWMVRITTKQISKLSNKKVFTRADSYLIETAKDTIDLLKSNDYYLSEDMLKEYRTAHTKIEKSGISIKMSNSKSYQILKIGPNSFYNLFDSSELGAGASLYCLRNNELHKNLELISGWNSTPEKMAKYFKEFTNNNPEFYNDKNVCQIIKTWSCNQIHNLVTNTVDIKKIVFNGEGIYDEPYSAYYFYQDGVLSVLDSIPFYVTTGSGRSKGDYTIVLKPTI